MIKHMRMKRAEGLSTLPGNRTALLSRSAVLCALFVSLGGCSALHPLSGYSADDLPVEYRLPSRTPQRTIDLSLLRQNPPNEHLVDAGDILGIYVQGVLGNAETPPPVYTPTDGTSDPSIGYPIRVDTDGTISLPMLDPLPVRGLTISQARQVIRNAYTRGHQAVVQPGQDHIHVTLQKARTYQVIVIREEAGNEQGNRGAAAVVNFETGKRGTGRVVNLPAHRNDVLNALTQTGGLPGLDAENVIYVIRGSHRTSDCQCQLGQADPAPKSGGTPGDLIQQAAWERNDTNPLHAPVGGHSVSHAHYTPAEPNRLTVAAYAGSLQTAQFSTRQPGQRYAPRLHALEPPFLSAQNQAGQPTGQSFVQSPASHSSSANAAFSQLEPAPASQMLGAPTGSFGAVDLSGLTSRPCERCLQNQGPNIIRIPLKVFPGEPMCFRPEDVVLNDGDIVLVENRVTEFFYTAGLLGGGQYALPRDYDIGVMDAIALAESQTRQQLPTSTIGGASVLNQDVSVGASRVVVQRKMADGSFVPIEINLYDVLKNPGQQVMIRPEDRIILRYTRCEAVLAYFERFFIDGLIRGAASALAFQN